MNNLIGTQLDQYQLVSFIDRGGVTQVYQAHPLDGGPAVAVKLAQSDPNTLENIWITFKHEVEIAKILRHERIIHVFGCGKRSDMVYLVMQLAAGGNLGQIIHHKTLPLAMISQYLEQMASILDYIHGQGICHCDITPRNILLDTQNNLLLTDFGIAQRVSGDTFIPKRSGTPAYMSPEQWEGRPVSKASDIYSLGALLYQLLTGFPPFNAQSREELKLMHLTQTPIPLRLYRPGITASTQQVVNTALAKDPFQRFNTVKDLVQAFQTSILESI